ncbi:hypothetical protein BJX76DRAFT_103808 [Aspergillus varians]
MLYSATSFDLQLDDTWFLESRVVLNSSQGPYSGVGAIVRFPSSPIVLWSNEAIRRKKKVLRESHDYFPWCRRGPEKNDVMHVISESSPVTGATSLTATVRQGAHHKSLHQSPVGLLFTVWSASWESAESAESRLCTLHSLAQVAMLVHYPRFFFGGSAWAECGRRLQSGSPVLSCRWLDKETREPRNSTMTLLDYR